MDFVFFLERFLFWLLLVLDIVVEMVEEERIRERGKKEGENFLEKEVWSRYCSGIMGGGVIKVKRKRRNWGWGFEKVNGGFEIF